MRLLFLLLTLSFVPNAFPQPRTGLVTGIVIDENDIPLKSVSIQLLNNNKGTFSNDSGFFKLEVTANKPFALVFSYTGYIAAQRNFSLHPGEAEKVTIKLQRVEKLLENVIVKDNRDRTETGRINIDASRSLVNPSAINGIESLIKVFVGSNNELTSQYSVRGGNYDENLVYVNDFEVYRPYLVSNAQQEGLSFINPELTSNVKFYTGGFQSKYGDKISSVLDISYRKPKQQGGSAYMSLLEQGLHIEGTLAKEKFTYLLGLRTRNNRQLLSSQDTRGSYIPFSSDIQSLFSYQISNKWQLEMLTNFSSSKFTLYPLESQLTAAVFSPLYTANVGLDIFFEGREKDAYITQFIGLSAIHQANKKLRLKWLISRFTDDEQENKDIKGDYLFGERDFDNTNPTYGSIINPLGAGTFHNYSRNQLNIDIINASHKGSFDAGKHYWQWGVAIDRQSISDKLNEWEYSDSAGYSLPYNGSDLQLNKVYNSKADLNIWRTQGYLQDNIQFKNNTGLTIQTGLRYNYNTLNHEFLLSPRIGFSLKPKNWQKDIILKAAAGAYHQPAFYREMRKPDGSLNTAAKAQKSWQLTAGVDYNFTLFNRPARIATEAYYKYLTNVIPYDLDNVRIRYFGENKAKAYATGIEARLFGELVKDAESWISIGFMRTRENLEKDQFTIYRNAAGEIIGPKTADKIPTDSSSQEIGWLRRPSDRLITFGMFLQDYLSTNKNFKVYLNTLYGSNLPYNISGSTRYRNALIIDPYLRIDIGFSSLLLDPSKKIRSHSPFRNFESIWASLEIFNLIDKANTISYQLIKDFSNNIFTMPNRLTPRLLNFKIVAKW